MNEFHLILSNPHYVCRLRGPSQPSLERVRRSNYPIPPYLKQILPFLDITLVSQKVESCSDNSLMRVLIRMLKSRMHPNIRVDVQATVETVSSPQFTCGVEYYNGPAPSIISANQDPIPDPSK
jgi:hypothetical protein